VVLNLRHVPTGTHGDASNKNGPAVFVRHDGDGKVEGLPVLQVDVSLGTGRKVFLEQKVL
jgi:hypothetical protein